MSEGAKVDSIDVLRQFRVALLKFAETANVALGDAESDLHRVQNWLETEQLSYWQGQIRKRAEIVSRAKEAVRMKKVFKDATGVRESVVDEEKALLVAARTLQEAEQKLVSVKQWTQKLQKEAQAYKGSVQRVATAVQSSVPVAAAKLDRMSAALEAYVALSTPAGDYGQAPQGASSVPPAAPQAASNESPAVSSQSAADADAGEGATRA